jgi:hypothetical protein
MYTIVYPINIVINNQSNLQDALKSFIKQQNNEDIKAVIVQHYNNFHKAYINYVLNNGIRTAHIQALQLHSGYPLAHHIKHLQLHPSFSSSIFTPPVFTHSGIISHI